MTKSILRYFIIILIATLLSSCFISATLISNSLLSTTKQDMLYSLKLIDYAIDYQQPLEQQIEKLNPLAYSDQTRISVIDKEGMLLQIRYLNLYLKTIWIDKKFKRHFIILLVMQEGDLKQQMRICYMLLITIRIIYCDYLFHIMDY